MPDAMLTPWDPKRGAAVVAAALAEWERDVRESPGPGVERIRLYINGIGGPGASYDADGDYKWCGAFAAFCLVQAGARPDLLAQKTPPERGGLGSHYRAACLGALDSRRLITRAGDVRAGDVIVVGRSNRSKWGEHIAVATGGAHNGTNPTVEGNAYGVLPDGGKGEGVVKWRRQCEPGLQIKGFRFGLRLLPGDFDSEVFHG